MGLNSPEKQLVGLQEIQLGQEFLLFDPLYIEPRPEDPRLYQRAFTLALGATDLPELHFRSEIGFTETTIGGRLLFLPFEPEKGYVATNEDRNSETRKAKLTAILESEPSDSERLKGEYMFTLTASTLGKEISTETAEMLDRLRIRLSIGHMLLEGRRMHFAYEKGQKNPSGFVYFARFYPADMGEFAPDAHEETGQPVSLPNSTEKLSQIRARFVLADQEPVEMGG